jgi:DNA-binding response OmpR family regulator
MNRRHPRQDSPGRAGDPAETAKPSVPTILIVDDDPDMRIYLKRCLSRMRQEIGRVFEASDGMAALARVRQGDVDLVISDVIMPRLDGIAMIRAMRGDEAVAHISVLLVTGEFSAREVLERTDSAARVDVLTKPFNTQGLCEKVRGLLSRGPPGRHGPLQGQ